MSLPLDICISNTLHLYIHINMSKKHAVQKFVVFVFVFFQFAYLFLLKVPQFNTPVDSGNLTSASDTLSNSRLSFYGKVSGTYISGSSSFTMQGSGNPDNNTNNLFPNDTVLLGSNNSQNVASVSSSLNFSTSTVTTNQLANGDAIYATQSATHALAFTTASTIVDGAIRVLVPAGDSTSASNNHLPDGGGTAGFDFNGMTSSDVTCPTGGSVTWAAATATASATFGSNLHAFECRFTGTLNASTALTMTVGGTNKLINPAPKTGHVQGTADTYTVKIQELQYPSYAPIDETSVTVSPIEAVLVSATVNPSLTFTIASQNQGLTRCGRATTVATTATSVPFGNLTGSDTFYHAAQQLSISTNATTGYTIKVGEDDELTKLGSATTIADTTCDSSGCPNPATYAKWTSTGTYGWGYSLENVSAATIAFQYNTNAGACDGTGDCSKQFACTNASNCSSVNSAETVASSSGPVSTQSFYVCYRLDYGPTQATGYYQTRVMYTAIAAF